MTKKNLPGFISENQLLDKVHVQYVSFYNIKELEDNLIPMDSSCRFVPLPGKCNRFEVDHGTNYYCIYHGRLWTCRKCCGFGIEQAF